MRLLKKPVLAFMTSMTMLLSACGIFENKSQQEAEEAVNMQETPAEEETKGEEEEYALTAEMLNIIETKDGINYIQNPENIQVLVNKDYSLPIGYRAEDLVEPEVKFSFDEKHEKRLMRKEAAEALAKMFNAALEDGIEIVAVSGFRSYERQQQLYTAEVAASGAEHAQQAIAEPGKSEHQTGLTMDVSSAENLYNLNQDFGNTEAGKWLAEHSSEYGFIIRYPEGKENITGYMYEPWHVRYVGTEVAKDIYSLGLSFEEYVQLVEE